MKKPKAETEIKADQSQELTREAEISELNQDQGSETVVEAESDCEVKLQEVETKLKESEDKLLRLAAEYDNFRKRTRKEKEELYASSVCDVMEVFLPVIDNLDRAIEAASLLSGEESQKMLSGLEMINKQVSEVLAKLGVNEIEALGQCFDPNIHDAVFHVEDENLPENQVAEVLLKGYQRGERVIRHSMVKVAN